MSIRSKAMLAVMLGNTIFGFSFLFSKVALEIAPPTVMVAMRFLTAFVILNIIVFAGRLIKNKDGQPLVKFSLKGKPLKYVLLLALFQPVIYFIGESYGIVLTSSAFSGTIIAIIPIIGVVFDVILMHVKVSKKQIVCAVASVIGVIVTTLGAENMKSSAAGTVMLLIAVMAGSLFYVFSKKSGTDFNPLEQTYVMFAVGSAAFVVFAVAQYGSQFKEVILPAVTSGEFWGCILYLGLVSSVIAFMLLNFGNKFISVSQASIFVNLTTVISIVAGVTILGETFTLQQVIGAVIIIGSVYIASIEKNKVEV